MAGKILSTRTFATSGPPQLGQRRAFATLRPKKKEKHVQIHTDGPFYTFESPFNESANDDFDIPAGTIKLTLQTCELVHLTRVRDMFTYLLIENEQYDRLDQDSVAWEVEECLGDNSEG